MRERQRYKEEKEKYMEQTCIYTLILIIAVLR